MVRRISNGMVQGVLVLLALHAVVQDGAYAAFGEAGAGAQAFFDGLAADELLEDGRLDGPLHGQVQGERNLGGPAAHGGDQRVADDPEELLRPPQVPIAHVREGDAGVAQIGQGLRGAR
jgi:hypothetical protein